MECILPAVKDFLSAAFRLIFYLCFDKESIYKDWCIKQPPMASLRQQAAGLVNAMF